MLAHCSSLSFAQDDLLNAAQIQVDSANYSKASKLYREWLSKNERSIPMDSFFLSVLIKHSSAELLCNEFDNAVLLNNKIQNASQQLKSKYFFYKAQIDRSEIERKLNKNVEGKERLLNLVFDKKDSLLYLNLVCGKYDRLAAIFNELGDLDSALIFTKLTINISKQLNSKFTLGTAFNELGNIFEKKGEIDSAIFYYKSAETLLNNEKHLRFYLNVYYNRVRLYCMNHPPDSCIYHLNKILLMAGEREFPRLKYPIYSILAQQYYKKNDSLGGARMKIMEMEQYDLVQRSENEKALLEIEAIYKNNVSAEKLKQNNKMIEEQNKVIEFNKSRFKYLITGILVLLLFLSMLYFYYRKSLKVKKQLNRSYEKLDLQNKELTRLLKDNEFLIQESHHRIKNNLQLVISLIQMEIGKEKPNFDLGPLQNISAQMRAISSLHKHLYMNPEVDSIQVQDYFSEIEKNLSHLLKPQNIEIVFEISELQMKVKDAVYLGLILTELITNSSKHAFLEEQDKKIHVSFRALNAGLLFHYKDNGKGGKTISNRGKGMHLVELLCKQIKGKNHYDMKDGISFRIEF